MTAQRERQRRSDTGDAGQCAETIEQVARPRKRLVGTADALRVRPDVDDQPAGHRKAGIGVTQARKTLHEPPGAGDEDQRERHLGDRHRAHHLHGGAAAARRPAIFIHQRLQVGSRQANGRRDPEHDAADQ
ncbi:MAG: hypothetical protein DMG01_22420, partial [Acidobacteria bacterium]